MKIITGYLKNRNLIVPQQRDQIRASTGFIKKAIMDILGYKNIADAVVLDLYAGSGSVGIEFLSNYAGKTVFVEKDPQHIMILKKNLNNLKIEKDKYQIFTGDVRNALQYLNKKNIFDYIFLDPPYKENLVNQTLHSLIQTAGIFTKETVIIAEHHCNENTTDTIAPFFKTDSRKYGTTVLDFYEIPKD